MCLEACVKGQAELQQVQLFGEDPAVIFRLEDEVIRALRAPGLLGLQDVLGDVARLEPPCLVLLKGPAGTGKKSIVMELARVNGMTVLQLDKAALEAAQQAAWRAGAIRWPGCVVQAAFSLAKKLQPCIVLLDKPHTLPKRMQAAVRAELQRLHGAPHLWPLQRVSVVATINHVHDWHPPFHVPARHRGETALPNIQQRRAIMLGYLQRLQQPGRPPAVQPLLMSLLTGRITGGLLGEQVEEFIASLQGRAGRQIVWLVLRAQQRVATAAAGAAGAALVAEPHRPLALADLRAALQDLVAEEALAAQQRACTSWWPWDWSPSMWVCAGALGLGVGATAAIVLADGGSRRGSGAPEANWGIGAAAIGAAAIGAAGLWLFQSSQRLAARACLEACVKGRAELQQVQLFGEDPAVVQHLADEVLRPLEHPEVLVNVLGDAAAGLEPPYLVLLQGQAGTGKKSIVKALARSSQKTIRVLQLDKAALEAAQQAAWRAGAIRWPGCVVQAAFSLAKKLQPCIVLLDKPHTLLPGMQAALSAELQRLHGAPHLWPLQRVSVVATINRVHDWQPPFHVPARHRGETALPNIQQRRAIMLGYLQRLQQPGRPPAVQPLLMSLLTGRITGGLLGEQVEEFIASLQGRAGRQIVWLVLRAQQRVAMAAAGAAGAALVAEPHRPLALADLRAALQDLVAEEALAAQQRACTSWWPWDWSPSMWVCAGALGLGVGATAAIALADGGGRRGSGAPEVAVAP
ncbi:hypothetical protein HYH02_011216 [Chlamydomonas schloesseri]|uniref:AAA+ ATPase domain-containing protein n=1 Tax=Chlamydomonas schloesseri TaxID=2026947 RepID=A0A835W353_9CHLO|nr:hypothetical protein HYH02_011216 [Chlamydomonas schloesseri]|eukprot:KAG2437575.1 hypothetical protein HYH02_011216 [Chlamydomonas schloesseri]